MGNSVPAPLEVSHQATLRWALGAPKVLPYSILHLFSNQLPLQGLVIEQISQYFAPLMRPHTQVTNPYPPSPDERGVEAAIANCVYWVVSFVDSALSKLVEISLPAQPTNVVIGWQKLEIFYHLQDTQDFSTGWIYVLHTPL